MAVSWASVTARAPDLSTVAAGSQTAILDDVLVLLSNASAWQSTALHELAQIYLAAHLGTLNLRAAAGGSSGGAGAIASESVGDVSVSYSNPTTVDTSAAAYTTTAWGLQFLALSRRSFMRGIMVV